MISVRLEGVKDVIESIRDIPTAVGRRAIFEGAAEGLATVLAEKTPPGWSGNLRKSAMSESVLVGYSAGVEQAGNRSLDGKPARGRRKWVSVEELEAVLMESVQEYTGSVLAEYANEVESVLP